jgi:hypothetical protein
MVHKPPCKIIQIDIFFCWKEQILNLLIHHWKEDKCKDKTHDIVNWESKTNKGMA